MALTKDERKEYEKRLKFLQSRLQCESGSDAKETERDIAYIKHELAQ